MRVHMYVSAGERGLRREVGVWLRNSQAVRFCLDWILSKVITQTRNLNKIYFMFDKFREKKNVHATSQIRHKTFVIPCFFYSELIFISASHITEIKSCLQVDTPMQRWLQRCSRRGKNRCFRQIFRYSWMQLISFEWIRLRVQGKSNIFRIDRQLHLVDLDSNEDQPLIDLTIFCHDESATWHFYFQIFGYLYSCKSISWNGALFGQPFCLLAGKTSLLILPILTMMWIGTSIGVSRLTTLGTCFLAACIVSSVMLLLLSRWELRSFHANKFPANMELNEEVLRILRFLLNRWIPCVQAHLKSYAIMANYDFGWGIDQF